MQRRAGSPVRADAGVVAECFADLLQSDREIVCVACLDVRNRIIGLYTAFIGTTDWSLVHPRENPRTALVAKSAVSRADFAPKKGGVGR